MGSSPPGTNDSSNRAHNRWRGLRLVRETERAATLAHVRIHSPHGPNRLAARRFAPLPPQLEDIEVALCRNVSQLLHGFGELAGCGGIDGHERHSLTTGQLDGCPAPLELRFGPWEWTHD